MKLRATNRELLVLRDILNQRTDKCAYQMDDVVEIEFNFGKSLAREDCTTYHTDAPIDYAPKVYRAQSLSDIFSQNRRR